MDKPIEDRTLEQVQEALSELLLAHFRPAPNEQSATQMLSTEQLLHIVNSHSPGLVPPNMFRECMLGLSFDERYINGSFVWLLMER